MKYDICVIGGAGHVGLPLAIAFAVKGQKVAVYDINKSALKTIDEGKMPFMESGAEELLGRVINKTLFTTDQAQSVSESKFIVVVIGTPVDEHLNPRFHDMKKIFNQIIPYLRDDQIIILRSTVYPGVTAKIRDTLQKHHPDLEVCFCPERISEGKAMEELYSLPQIVSGFTSEAVQQVSDLFRLFSKEIIVLSPMEAELAKLFTNSWRYIQFAIANQFYMVAEEYGSDFYKIFHAITHNYPRTRSFPKPGFAAGPCLFKDTMQISAFTNNRFFLGHSAMLVNEGLPDFVVQQFKKKHPLAKMTVGILGMAFKAESDDKRDSLSYKLRKILEVEAKDVLCSDEYIREPGFVSAEELINRCDAIFIGVCHNRYLELDFQGKIIIDVWNDIGGKNNRIEI
jgi:UDP-N-acetyl-D-mannosaminuronic acid dehydrogenase